MKRLKKSQTKWLVLLIATVVLGALLITSIAIYFDREGQLLLGGQLRAEYFYLILVFLLLIPLLLTSVV